MSENKSRGLGLCSILTIIFVIAKIFGFINWSWWLVFMPTIAVIGFWVLIFVIALIVTAFME